VAEVFRLPQRLDLGRPWTPTRASEILELPPAPSWIWDGRIMRGQVTILGGEAKIGKSLLLQQLLSACAVGRPCLGRHTERCRAFGYFAEDTEDWLRTRQFAIKDALGVEMSDFEDYLQWQSRATDDCILADLEYGKIKLTGEWDHLWRVIEDEGSELVGIDTARAVFQGNEMQARQVTPFLRELQKKAIQGNRAIILAAHPPTGNVSKGYAGTGAWLASARAGLSLERPDDYDPVTDTPASARVLRGLGANYSAGRSIDRLRWEHGVFVSDENGDPPGRADSQVRRDVLDREMLLGLYKLRNNGGMIPADVMMPKSLPRCYRLTFDRAATLNDLYASQERLLSSRQIVRVRVAGRCLLRPADGAKYDGEEHWSI
jgi:RecA-family ATPase